MDKVVESENENDDDEGLTSKHNKISSN